MPAVLTSPLFLPASALRTLRSKKQQSSSGGLSLSLSQAATPRKTLSFSAVNTPVNSGLVQESSTATDAALFTSLDEPRLRQRTVTTTHTFTSVDGQSGKLSTTRSILSELSRCGLTGCAALPQGGGPALITGQVSTGTPAHRNPTPPPPMDTSAKTAPFTLRGRTPTSHSRHRRRRPLSWSSLPLTSCPRPHHHRRLSQAYTPETGVEGARLVRSCSALLDVGVILPDAS